MYHEVTVNHSELITDFPIEPTKLNHVFIGWRDEFDIHINELTPINRTMELIRFANSIRVTFIDDVVGNCS